MKTHRNNNHLKQSILLLTLALASCSQANDISNSEYLGQANSKAMIAKVHNAYLNCYPLNEAVKKQCLSDLEVRYIEKQHQEDKDYIQAFQFESEKLAFKHFLNDLKLPCESIKDGPEFVSDKQAYLVKCIPNHQYLMQFNYKTEEWSVVKENVNG